MQRDPTHRQIFPHWEIERFRDHFVPVSRGVLGTALPISDHSTTHNPVR